MIYYICRTSPRGAKYIDTELSLFGPSAPCKQCVTCTMCQEIIMIYKEFQRAETVGRYGGNRGGREGKKEGGGGRSFINSPAVVATPCWTVNHQWPQNYRHGSPADSKNCLLIAIYGPASQAGPPLSLASPRCAHILTSWRHYSLAHQLTGSLQAARRPLPPPQTPNTFLGFP